MNRRVSRPLPPLHSVLTRPRGTFLQIEWNGLGGTSFYVRARDRAHAVALYDELLQCPDVASITLFVSGRFAGARDGAGS